MRRMTAATTLVSALVLALVAGACGDDGPDVPPVAAPPAAGPSPVYGFPLPRGAAPDAEHTTAERESFFVPAAKARFADLDAFYRRQMDDKPFRDLAWCGAASDAAQVYGLRVWKRDGGEDVFVLSLKSELGSGTRINAVQLVDPGQQCPPEPIEDE